MSPITMTLLLAGGWGIFIWSARRRWKLMMIGRPESRGDRIGERWRRTLKFAIGQARMPRYQFSGLAHVLVFSGFVVLLLRSLILWGRGYGETFNFWVFGPTQPLGMIYALLKDTFVLLVILGTIIFFYYRLIRKLGRLTLNWDGIIILAIILVMMLADVVYDGAHMANPDNPAYRIGYAGYTLSTLLTGLSPTSLRVMEHLGFWTHTSLVLIFLNILPYSKHFHIITAVPNVFASDLTPAGRLAPIEDMEGKIEREETLGVATIDNLSWKGILDLYTCTECGRCSDVCPATKTGKLLSPKHLAVDLRDHLYGRQGEALNLKGGQGAADFSPRDADHSVDGESGGGVAQAEACGSLEKIPLVSDAIIKPEVLWACTTCRACEEECPVFITFVDKIVDLRRNLVMERAEFPDELQNLFRGLETSGNPWSYPADDRLKWTKGLDIPLISDHSNAEVLFWVGCAGAFDARAQKVTIATAKLLKHAGVNFAVLGLEETCTGDPARRAGNEFLFQMMAEQNCETFKGHAIKKIITACPHCFNTLKNEYPDFGGTFEVIHHTDFLLELVRDGKLKPQKEVSATVAYHDSCYLGRFNGIYDSPREILSSIPGVTLVEPQDTRDRGMCCGAGGAQMFKEEEQGSERVNAVRTQQLLLALDRPGGAGFSPRESDHDLNDQSTRVVAQTEACGSLKIASSACPFCMRMLTDGIAGAKREEVRQLDVAEVLCESVLDNH